MVVKRQTTDKWGFSFLEIGDAFDVPFDAISLAGLNSIRAYWGRKLDRNFSITTVRDDGVYEVSRLPGGYANPGSFVEPEIKRARKRVR